MDYLLTQTSVDAIEMSFVVVLIVFTVLVVGSLLMRSLFVVYGWITSSMEQWL